MNQRTGRILEAAAIHAAQKSVEHAISVGKEWLEKRKGWETRIAALETDMTALKQKKHTDWGRCVVE